MSVNRFDLPVKFDQGGNLRVRNCRDSAARASIREIEPDGYFACNREASLQSRVMRQRLWLLLLLPLLASGCVTHKLWSEKAMDEWNEPAANPNLRLFRDARQDDLLVVYDEYSNRHYTTQARAFFLRQNLKPLDERVRPHFVSTNLAAHLSSVPVFSSVTTNAPELFYAVTTNGGNFTLFSNRLESGSYSLPAYNDGIGRKERIAWTPLTVAADLTIVGGVLAVLCWDALAQSNTSFSAP